MTESSRAMTTPQPIEWVEPLEPQPFCGDFTVERSLSYEGRMHFYNDTLSRHHTTTIPFSRGDVVEHNSKRVRITSVDCKLVKDVTEAEAEAAGFRAWKYYGVDISVLKDFKERWEGDHPQPPFDSSYCWLVRGVEVEG